MKKWTACWVGASLLSGGAALAAGGVHWGYTGAEGPEYWGSLSEKFAACSEGKNQSPIDITATTEAELSPVEFAYRPAPLKVVNNGHTIQVDYPQGSTLTVDGRTSDLLQFHFHTPSENLIEGRSFPLEAHLVHSDANGNLSVVGIVFEEGEPNPLIDRIWAVMPEKAGDSASPSGVSVDAAQMLPEDRDYYRFNGSLTTPPCTEGVSWMVLKEPMSVSGDQVERFHHVMHHDNNRPVQAVNARPILK